MIEYLYSAIRVTAGANEVVAAQVCDAIGNPITEGCYFVLHLTDNEIAMIKGNCNEEGIFTFEIPAEVSKNLKGRYWYCIKHYDTEICFKQPIYFV